MKHGTKTWILFVVGCCSIFSLFQFFINKRSSSQEIFDNVLNKNEKGQPGNDILNQRTIKIRQICKTKGHSEDDIPIHEDTERSSLHYYKPLEILICIPPKSGSTFTRKFINSLINKNPIQSQSAGANYGNIQVKQFNDVNSLPVKAKIAVFRHPFERLLSGWNQMFESRCGDNCGRHTKLIGRSIVRELRPNASEQEIEDGCPTFDEFLRYASMVKSKHKYNTTVSQRDCPASMRLGIGDTFNTVNHWRPISVQCHPCQIKYDYFVLTDNLSYEMPLIMKRLEIPLPKQNNKTMEVVFSNDQSKNENRKKAISSVTAETYQKVIARYKYDFDIFGFSIPSYKKFREMFSVV